MAKKKKRLNRNQSPVSEVIRVCITDPLSFLSIALSFKTP